MGDSPFVDLSGRPIIGSSGAPLVGANASGCSCCTPPPPPTTCNCSGIAIIGYNVTITGITICTDVSNPIVATDTAHGTTFVAQIQPEVNASFFVPVLSSGNCGNVSYNYASGSQTGNLGLISYVLFVSIDPSVGSAVVGSIGSGNGGWGSSSTFVRSANLPICPGATFSPLFSCPSGRAGGGGSLTITPVS